MRQYASPIFQHRHYAEIANVVRECRRQAGGLRWYLERELEELFARDNPRFDRARYEAACSNGPGMFKKDKR